MAVEKLYPHHIIFEKSSADEVITKIFLFENAYLPNWDYKDSDVKSNETDVFFKAISALKKYGNLSKSSLRVTPKCKKANFQIDVKRGLDFYKFFQIALEINEKSSCVESIINQIENFADDGKKEDLIKLKLKKTKILNEINKYENSFWGLKKEYDLAVCRGQIEKIKEKTWFTLKTGKITAFLTEKDGLKLKSELKNAVIIRDKAESSLKIAKFENTKTAECFENLVVPFGVPTENSIDPTALSGLFFVLVFGISVSDFVYGLAIFVLGLFLSVKKCVKRKEFHFAERLMFCGGSASFFGILFSSFCGNIFELLNEFSWISLKISYNPNFENKIFMFIGLSLILGFFVILSGMFLNYYNEIKSKNRFRVTLKNVLKSLTSGIKLLSFMRISALGLGSELVSAIINSFTVILAKNPKTSFAGYIVFLLGHILNLFLTSVCSYIQSLRLVNVEFLGSFYKGISKYPDMLKPKFKYLRMER